MPQNHSSVALGMSLGHILPKWTLSVRPCDKSQPTFPLYNDEHIHEVRGASHGKR